MHGTGRKTHAPVAQTLQTVRLTCSCTTVACPYTFARTNTANRAPNMLMHHRYVIVHVCTISILWNFHTNPYQSSETTTRNNSVTVPVKPQERQITSCRARARQHARPSHNHCKACAKHAHAPLPRYCTRFYDFHPVEFSHQPVPVQ